MGWRDSTTIHEISVGQSVDFSLSGVEPSVAVSVNHCKLVAID